MPRSIIIFFFIWIIAGCTNSNQSVKKRNRTNDSSIQSISYSVTYLNSLSQDEIQLRLFYPDDLINQFEALIETIFLRNTKDIIKEYYHVKEVLESESGHNILLMQLIKTSGKGYPK